MLKLNNQELSVETEKSKKQSVVVSISNVKPQI